MKVSTRKQKPCNGCNEPKYVKAYGFCDNCWKKLKRKTDPEFFLRHLYVKMKERCTNINNKNSNIYFGKAFCSQKTFLDRFTKDKGYLETYYSWVASGWVAKFTPSVDRIDNFASYDIENIQIIAHYINCIKDKHRVKLNVFNRDGSFLAKFNSIADASRALGVDQTSISMVASGRRNYAGNYVFQRIENDIS